MAKAIKKGITGFAGGIAKTLKGVANVVIGVVTLDMGKISEGAAGIFLGVAQTVTFGGFQPDLAKNEPVIEQMEGRKVMARGAETPRRITYGRSRVGGQLAFFESTGDDSQFMHMIVVIAPHLIEGIDEIYFNDDLAFNADGSAAGQFAGKATVTKVLGDQVGAITSIVDAVPSWTTSHKLLGCAFIYVRLTYDKEAYGRGMPSVSAVVRGKKIFNPATNTTVYTRNHALVCLDYLQSHLGFRATAGEIDLPSFIAGAAICDQQVPAATGTEPRYTIDGTISLADNPIDNLESLARAGAAIINYVQGRFTYVAGAYSSPVMSLNESDLIGGVSVITGLSKSQLINTAKGSYIDARLNFEPASFVPITLDAYKTLDGEELLADMPMEFASSPTLARRLAKIAIETNRFGVTASLTLKFRGLQLTVGDRINLSIARFGWANKVFRVDSMAVGLSAGVSVTLREDAPSVWSWNTGDAVDINIPPALNLPNKLPMAAPTGLNVLEQLNTPLTKEGNRSTLVVSATPPADPRFNHIRYSMRLQGFNEWESADYSNSTEAAFVVDSNGATFEFRAQAVSQVGVVSEQTEIITHTLGIVGPNSAISEGGKPDAPLQITVPSIKRLELVNRITEDDWDKFKSGNAEFRWAKLSNTLGGSITQLNGTTDLHLQGYNIRIKDVSGKILREEQVRDSFYTYTYDENVKDTGGNPVRKFKFEVQAVATTGHVSAWNGFEVENPAPAAPSGIAFEVSYTTIAIRFNLPTDVDFVGVDLFVVEGAGNPYAATPRRLSGNSVLLEGLNQNTQYTIGLRSVDQFGTGGQVSAFSVTTNDLNAADVTGLGAWATEDEVSAAFVSQYMASGSISSALIAQNAVIAEKIAAGAVDADKLAAQAVTNTKLANLAVDAAKLADSAVTATKIANLAVGTAAIQNLAVTNAKIGDVAAGKITAGQVNVTVDVGTGVRLNGASGTVQTQNSGYVMTMGAHAIGGTTYVLSAADGALVNFAVLPNGSGKFGQLTLGADGSISGPEFSIGSGGATFGGTLSAATGVITNISATNIDISGTSTFGDFNAGKYMAFTGGELEVGRNANLVGVDSFFNNSTYLTWRPMSSTDQPFSRTEVDQSVSGVILNKVALDNFLSPLSGNRRFFNNQDSEYADRRAFVIEMQSLGGSRLLSTIPFRRELSALSSNLTWDADMGLSFGLAFRSRGANTWLELGLMKVSIGFRYIKPTSATGIYFGGVWVTFERLTTNATSMKITLTQEDIDGLREVVTTTYTGDLTGGALGSVVILHKPSSAAALYIDGDEVLANTGARVPYGFLPTSFDDPFSYITISNESFEQYVNTYLTDLKFFNGRELM